MKNKLYMLFASILIVASSNATELIYTPVNPSFGGSPLNGTFLLNKANAQNDHTSATSEKSFVTRFKESLERNIMNTITRGVATGDISDGVYDTGDFRIEVATVGDGVVITITNLLTGEITVIEMPVYGG
ncbi:curli assembly protein CsgF [Shewanella gelidii]|uniref:Curli production assembly/transport component CsgF n=1 Tax=Shewanella gelidii TaxID=1642821 RepID=A0A917NC31_9GAMM|nr:curli assembly protein CsgF [Shewanella gelidii]MCL1098424.1 curli assembly protein CsgF [Shewanella gelidii]GGI82828.1 curli production assembly protein CsgF [Shewanella gelidii]